MLQFWGSVSHHMWPTIDTGVLIPVATKIYSEQCVLRVRATIFRNNSYLDTYCVYINIHPLKAVLFLTIPELYRADAVSIGPIPAQLLGPSPYKDAALLVWIIPLLRWDGLMTVLSQQWDFPYQTLRRPPGDTCKVSLEWRVVIMVAISKFTPYHHN